MPFTRPESEPASRMPDALPDVHTAALLIRRNRLVELEVGAMTMFS